MDAPLLVLDLGFDVIDCIGGLHLEGDSFPGEGLDKDLHAVQQRLKVGYSISWPDNAERAHWLGSGWW